MFIKVLKKLSELMRSVYPTLLDPLTQQITAKITKADVLQEIKTQALFFDVVSPSISHILSSKCTYEALKEEPELLTEGIVQPQIPKNLSNIDEYLQWIRMEEDVEWLKKFGIHLSRESYLTLFLNQDATNLLETTAIVDAQRELKERISFIDANVKNFWYYDQPAIAGIVRASIIRDLDPKDSPFSKDFKDVDEIKRIRSIALELLDKRGILGRNILFTYINARKPVDEILLKKIINQIYFICGAIAMDHMLGLEPCYIPLLSRKSEELTSIERKYLIAREIFSALLGYLKVDPQRIREVDIDTLKGLRKWSKKHLYRTIWNYVEKWERGYITSSEVEETIKPEIDRLNQEFEEILKSEVDRQKKNYKKIEVIRSRLEKIEKSIGVLAFLGTGLTFTGINHLHLIELSSGLLSTVLLTTNPIFNYLLHKKANLIVFSEKIKKL